ncbi:hypothetical protein RND71_021222 [Anisodus tanguticus]|uniref:Uncharacterized protein n=1 Tax=Anisodus tanguticus TaxID=243964 RepID=A0AAE1RW54_9SOLA|nr:hypothetical protein RND71_021222 [Anisodus tanguticus]
MGQCSALLTCSEESDGWWKQMFFSQLLGERVMSWDYLYRSLLPTELIEILITFEPEKVVASKLHEIGGGGQSMRRKEFGCPPQVFEGECAEWVRKRRLVVLGLTYLAVLTVSFLMKRSIRVLLICWEISQ